MIPTRTRSMLIPMSPWLVLFVGCGTAVISEKTLPGVWRAADSSGLGHAFQIKSASPSAKPSEIIAASKLLAATVLEVKEDGSFALQFGVNKYDGSWKFDKNDAMVDFAVKSVNGEPADVNKHFSVAFLGVMDRQDGSMRLVPSDRKIYEDQKKRGDKGLDVMSVLLNKG